MTMPRTYRAWRARANAYLAHHPHVDAWGDAHVLAMLRHTGEGMRLWLEARDHGFWEAAHDLEMGC